MLQQFLAELPRALERAGVRAALIGGHAVNAWVEPRATLDIDVAVVVAPGAWPVLEAELVSLGLALSRQHGADAPSGPDFARFTSPDNKVVLELQAVKTSFQREVVERAVTRDAGVPVATPEDLVVLKLLANRPKDQGDIAALLALPGLDRARMKTWASAWGVNDLLDAWLARPPPR